MKKVITALALVLLAFSLTNCTKKNLVSEIDSNNSSNFSLFANFEGTRTISDASGKLSWKAGDALNVYFNNGTEYVDCGAFVIKDISAGEFEGKLSEEILEKLSDQNDWYIFYPYNLDRSSPSSLDSGKDWISSKGNIFQQAHGDMSHIGGREIPGYGIIKDIPKGTIPSFKMNHIASLLAINITNSFGEDISVNRLEFSTTNYNIVGKFYIDFTKDPFELKESDKLEELDKTVKLFSNDRSKISNGSTAKFYIPIAPFKVADAEETICLKLYCDEEKTCTIDKSIAIGTEFKAGSIKDLNVTVDNYDQTYVKHLNATDSGTYIIVDETDSAVFLYNTNPVTIQSDTINSCRLKDSELIVEIIDDSTPVYDYSIQRSKDGLYMWGGGDPSDEPKKQKIIFANYYGPSLYICHEETGTGVDKHFVYDTESKEFAYVNASLIGDGRGRYRYPSLYKKQANAW